MRKSLTEIWQGKILDEFLSPTKLFKKYIEPEARDMVYEYVWVDLFTDEGDLILRCLTPIERKLCFLRIRIFLFCIQREIIEKAIKNTERYGSLKRRWEEYYLENYSQELPRTCIRERSIGLSYPPYMYLGYMARYIET